MASTSTAESLATLSDRIRNAWVGRISGCMLGKAVETYSMRNGHGALHDYLAEANALPLRNYIPYTRAAEGTLIDARCCAGQLQRSEADDDINYSLLALMLLEDHGANLSTEDVARAWLRHLPLASTYTAERAAYRTLLANMHEWFPEGRDPGFDLSLCAQNKFNDWIGAQIRADVYGWVCPGKPELAARLVTADAALSHQSEGVYGAVLVAVLGSLIPQHNTIDEALDQALEFIPADSECAQAVAFARGLATQESGAAGIRKRYADLHVVHTVNNLALVVWALSRHPDDFSAAIGDVVAAGLDTDCNGATVGALWALQGKKVPAAWVEPWQGRVSVSLAGQQELSLDQLTQRTVDVTLQLANAG